MKNFSKKLSFVMATAMVVTSLYAPQDAKAAAANRIVVAKTNETVKSPKFVYIGGANVDYDAYVKGKKVKDTAGTWSSSNKKVVTVDKNGVVKGVKNGAATITFKTKATKKAKSVSVKFKVNVYTRASVLNLTPAAVTVKEGESADVTAELGLSKKVQAAGGKSSTYKVFAESSDNEAAEVSVEGTKVTVKGVKKSATPATITVYAAQSKSLAAAKKAKTKLTKTFTVKVNSKLDAKQTGANKITVMGSDLVASKGAYVIKNAGGAVLPLKDMVTVNEAKTEAVLEGDTTQIPVGKYTLTYNNGDPVEFEVVKAVVKSIEIVPTNAAIMDKDGAEAYAYYKVYDQFGDDVTKSPLASRINVSGSDDVKGSKGKVVFTAPTSTKYQLNLSKVSVAVVDLETGVNASAILTVGEKAKLWEVEYKGIYDKVKRVFVENISDSDELANYELLFKGNDQYGVELISVPTSANDSAQLQVNAISVTGVTLQKLAKEKIGSEEYYAYTLVSAENPTTKKNASRAGEVTVQAIVVNNGKTVSKKFDVVSSTKVDTLTVREGALGVYENQDNELDFTALDAEGKEIKSWDKLRELNNDRNLGNNYGTGTTLRFEKKDDGKVVLMYNPGDVGADGNIAQTKVLTFLSQTNKFSTATLAVKDTRLPSSVLGLTSATAKGTTKSKNYQVGLKHLRFQDQYGNNMSAKEVAATGKKYRINFTVADAVAANTAFNASNGQLEITAANLDFDTHKLLDLTNTANTKSAVADATLVLEEDKASNNTWTKVVNSEDAKFNIYSVAVSDMSSFAIADPGLKPAANLDDTALTPDNSKDGFVPEVFGYYSGEKITLKADDDFKVIDGKDATHVAVPEIKDEKGTVTKEATAKVVIDDGNGTVKEVKYSYSNAARKAAKVEFTGNEMTGLSTNTKEWDDFVTAFGITVKDQYDRAITTTPKATALAEAPYVTFSDFDDKAITVAKNGTKGATVTFTATGANAVVTMKLTFPNSSYSIEKVVKFAK